MRLPLILLGFVTWSEDTGSWLDFYFGFAFDSYLLDAGG